MLEMLDSLELERWAVPVVLLAAGILAGLLAETYLVARLRRLADRSRWNWDDLILTALKGMAFVWFSAAGLYGVLQTVQMPQGLRSLLSRLLMVVVVFSVTLAGSRLAAGAIRIWSRRTRGGVPSTSLLQNVARILVFLLGAFLIVENLGWDVTALLTGLGIGGLAVALALQDTLSNLFSGFQIILARQVQTGDYVRLDTGEEGYVTDIQWRNTTIKSRLDDNEVVVPNAKLANAIVTNFDRPVRSYWVRLEVGVSYDSDLEEVERVTLEVAREVLEEHGMDGGKGSEPVLRYRGFGDSAITFGLRIRMEEYVRQYRVRHDLVKRLHARYREEGIEIPFPIRTLYAPKGLSGEPAPPPPPPSPERAAVASPRGGGEAPPGAERSG